MKELSEKLLSVIEGAAQAPRDHCAGEFQAHIVRRLVAQASDRSSDRFRIQQPPTIRPRSSAGVPGISRLRPGGQGKGPSASRRGLDAAGLAVGRLQSLPRSYRRALASVQAGDPLPHRLARARHSWINSDGLSYAPDSSSQSDRRRRRNLVTAPRTNFQFLTQSVTVFSPLFVGSCDACHRPRRSSHERMSAYRRAPPETPR